MQSLTTRAATKNSARSFSRSLLLALATTALLSACGGGPKLPRKPKAPTPTMGKREPILSRVESSAQADLDIGTVAVVLPLAQPNADWAQPGGSASKSYGNLQMAENPKPLWEAKVAGSTDRRRLGAAPVVGGGSLFVFDTDGVLHAFDAATGAAQWTVSFALTGGIGEAVFGGGATYDNGRVYVTTGVGDVAAVDAKTGKQLWKVRPAGPLRGSPTVAFGALYIMTQNNELHALKVEDGATLWQESASLGATGVFGVGAPAAGQGSVVAGFSTGELIAYRYENGRQLWNDALARTSLSTSVGVLTDIDADPIIDRGRVYALGQGGRMAAYELVTGQRIWELNLAGISTPALAGDWIFTLTDESKLLCIAKNSGKVRWVVQFDRWTKPKKKEGPIFWTGPVLAGDRLWVANSRGEVHVVNALEGVPKRYTEVKAPITLAPVVANGVLYLFDDSGKITALK
jgi:outer membrane protein assembly factor BamB